jgi:hypothetical protein
MPALPRRSGIWKRLLRRAPWRPIRRAPHRFLLEVLEDRTLPASATIFVPVLVQSFPTATPLDLSGGPVNQNDSIATEGAVNVYSFTAPSTGGLVLRQMAAPGSSLDSVMAVFNGGGRLIASNDDSPEGGTADSEIRLAVTAGQKYYVEAAGYHASTGAYTLSITTAADDFGNDFASAHVVTAAADGSAQQAGSIDYQGDLDVFKLTATAAGTFAVRLDGAVGSSLHPALTVFDSSASHNVLASQNDTAGTGHSVVTLTLTAGQTVYLQAASLSTGAAVEPYVLSVAPVADDFGNSTATAQDLTVASDGSATQAGTINYVGDLDVFQYVATASGPVTFRETASGPGLITTLTLLNSNGGVVATAAYDPTQPGTSTLPYNVFAGQTYFLQAGGASGTTGAYTVTASAAADDFGNTTATAHPLTVASDGSATQAGAIDYSGDVDVFRYVATAGGTFTIRQSAVGGSGLDSVLTVLDSSGFEIAYNDDDPAGGTVDSRVDIALVAGDTYYIEAGAFSSSTGAYQISVAPRPVVDDFGNTSATAADLTVAADGTATQTGAIDYPGDVDVFAYVATASGAFTVRQSAAGALDSVLTVFDSSGTQIARNDDDPAGGTLNSRVVVNFTEGSTYYIQAGAYSSSTGAYVLSVAPAPATADDYGNTIDTAHTISPVAADGSATQTGAIDYSSDVDVFAYVATADGTFSIRESAAGGSSLDSVLTVFDSSGTQIARNDDDPAGGTLNSRVVVDLVAGDTYYIQAGAYSSSTGAYVVSVAPVSDDFGNTIDTAHALTVAADGSATQAGTIDYGGDVDMFSYVATTSGFFTVRQSAAPGSAVDSAVTVYDSSGSYLAYSDDDPAGGTLDSRLVIYLSAGETYYIQAGTAYFSPTGAYQVSVSPAAVADDFGDDLGTAHTLNVSASGAALQDGNIDYVGDVDVFSYTATRSGTFTVTLSGDLYYSNDLTVYDGAGNFIDEDYYDAPASVQISVTAGQTYYFQADFTDGTMGAYHLAVIPAADDFGNTRATASTLTVGADGSASQSGFINYGGDVDVFRYVATTTGQFDLRQHDLTGSGLYNELQVFDSAGNLLKWSDSDPSGDTSDARLFVNLTAGHTYYIQAGTEYYGVTAYTVTVSPVVDDYPNSTATNGVLNVAADGSATGSGVINYPGDYDAFRYDATASGEFTFAQTAGSSGLYGYLAVYDGSVNFVGNTGSPTTGVTFAVTAGQTYYLQVGAYYGSVGNYAFHVVPAPDDYGNTIATAHDLTVASDGSATQDGTIDYSGDRDVFRYVAPVTGSFAIREVATGHSTLDSVLTVLDASGNQLAYNDDDPAGGTTNSRLIISLTAGQTYYIQAAGFSYFDSTGAYQISVTPQVDDFGNTPATAHDLAVASDGSANQSGTIDYPGDVDVFRYVAAASGTFTISQSQVDTTLRGQLTLYNASGNRVATGSADTTGNSQMTVSLVAGRTYYIQAAGGSTVGAYKVTVTPGASAFDSAMAVTVGADGTAGQAGTFAQPSGAQMYSFVAPFTGVMHVRQDTGSNSTLDSFLSVFDGTQALLASDDNGAGGLNSAIAFNVTAGQVYYVQASSAEFALPANQTGAYTLSFAETPAGGPGTATGTAPLFGPTEETSATVPAGGAAFYRLVVTGQGLLRASVHAPGLAATDAVRLSVLSADGSPLAQVDALGGGPDAALSLHLEGAAAGTTYYLEVQGPASAAFSLSSTFTSASAPLLPDVQPGSPRSLALGDFNHDGIPDLAVIEDYTASPGVYVLLGVGDGTYGPPRQFSIGGDFYSDPTAVAVGDFNHDGNLDLAVSDYGDNTVSVLFGRGDGTFGPPVRYDVGTGSIDILAVDLNHDGWDDLATANYSSNTVSILLNHGDGSGTFAPAVAYAVGSGPSSLAAGNFSGTGATDLAVTNYLSSTVSILPNNGDGTFAAAQTAAVGHNPWVVISADFNGDGRADLATANYGSNDVSVLFNQGGGNFSTPVSLPAGSGPVALAAVDLNGDGHMDLVAANLGANSLSVFQGDGHGGFGDPSWVGLPGAPFMLTSDDVNNDGRPDLIVANTNYLSVLLGNGAGLFEGLPQSTIGTAPAALAVGDFNRDHRQDLATINAASNTVSVGLGRGDGTFSTLQTLPVGKDPQTITTADLNGDGRLDLIVANGGSNDVSVLLGLGDGTFAPQLRFAAGASPSDVTVGDFNHDGHLDLAVADYGSGSVAILLGDGQGGFSAPTFYAAGALPLSVQVGDFNHDGNLDLAVADSGDNTVAVLLGHGDGTFAAAARYAVGGRPGEMVVQDFTGDGRPDIATADPLTHDVALLVNNGDGTFAAARITSVGTSPLTLTAANFTGGAVADLAVADESNSTVRVLRNDGTGHFTVLAALSVGDGPHFLATGDFNGDGHADLVIANLFSAVATVLLGRNDGTFVDATVTTPASTTPLLVTFAGNSSPDSVILDSAGDILDRLGLSSGSFGAPQLVNPDDRARDLVVLGRSGGPELAALDEAGDHVSIYRHNDDGTFSLVDQVATDPFSDRVFAGDLDGNGADDLIVLNAIRGTLAIYLAGPTGLNRVTTLTVGQGASDVAVADIDGDHRADLVVSNQVSGQVLVLPGLGYGTFGPALHFQAGGGPYGVSGGGVISGEGSAALAVGDINGDNRPDVVVANAGSNLLGVLLNDGHGGFAAPILIALDGLPTALRLGDFNGDGHADLAVLIGSQVEVYTGDGNGHFHRTFTADAGNEPGGLAVIADVDQDPHRLGVQDLVIGNRFGDVLALLGVGDGTFLPYQRADHQVALAVADLTGTGQDDIIYADPSLDRVSVQYGASTAQVLADRDAGVQGPGYVVLADVNGDGIPDLIVANSGSNNVLVYLGEGHGTFGPELNGGRGFFTGTSPTGITVTDINGDGRGDLVVANEGSNDVTILFGQGSGATFTFTEGPRLLAGTAPVSTAVVDVTGDGVADIVTADSGSHSLTVLPGVGGGFFNDQAAITLQVGDTPVQVLPITVNGIVELVAVDYGSNDLTVIDPHVPGGNPETIAVGLGPIAALARDVNGDGVPDLFVADNGDGRVALLLGGESGFAVAGFQNSPDAHPTALAFSAASDNPFQVYVVGEVNGTAELMTFELPSIEVPVVVAGSEANSGAARTQTFELLPVNDSGLGVVATLAVVTFEEATGEGGANAALGQIGTAAGAVIQVGGGDEGPAAAAIEPEGVGPSARFLAGLPEAWQKTRPLTAKDLELDDEGIRGVPAVRGRGAAVLDALYSSADWAREMGAGAVRSVGQRLWDLVAPAKQPGNDVPPGGLEQLPAPKEDGQGNLPNEQTAAPLGEVWLDATDGLSAPVAAAREERGDPLVLAAIAVLIAGGPVLARREDEQGE